MRVRVARVVLHHGGFQRGLELLLEGALLCCSACGSFFAFAPPLLFHLSHCLAPLLQLSALAVAIFVETTQLPGSSHSTAPLCPLLRVHIKLFLRGLFLDGYCGSKRRRRRGNTGGARRPEGLLRLA